MIPIVVLYLGGRDDSYTTRRPRQVYEPLTH